MEEVCNTDTGLSRCDGEYNAFLLDGGTAAETNLTEDNDFVDVPSVRREVNDIFVNYFPNEVHPGPMTEYTKKRAFRNCPFNDHQLKELRDAYQSGSSRLKRIRLILADKLGVDEPLIYAWHKRERRREKKAQEQNRKDSRSLSDSTNRSQSLV